MSSKIDINMTKEQHYKLPSLEILGSSIKELIGSKVFSDNQFELPIVLGTKISGEIYLEDLTKMPHILMSGITGQGKTVAINAMIASLLYSKKPDELKFVLIDPKMVEFSPYNRIENQYLAKIPDMEKAIITDFDNAIETLQSLCIEMGNRYILLKESNTGNIVQYNKKFKEGLLKQEKGFKNLPYIVVIIDEFADLIMIGGKEIEIPIARLAQKARAVGIHIIMSTQRPSTNIITGIIKANFPARIAFKVSQRKESEIILDNPGAEKLKNPGEMLIKNGDEIETVQGAFIDESEIREILKHIAKQPYEQNTYLLPESFMD